MTIITAAQPYHVTGVVQYGIYGGWSEVAVCEVVTALNPEQARRLVLARHEQAARGLDRFAVARWHTEELVRVEVER
jgi:hypothetical protein